MKSPWVQKKILLVDVDSLFEPSREGVDRGVYEFAVYAVRKAYKLGWSVQFWGSQPHSHYTRLVRELQRCTLWEFSDPDGNDPLLLCPQTTGDSSIKAKLSLLENHFGHILDGDPYARLVAVEKDFAVAQSLHVYSRGKIQVHLSPLAWPNLIAVGDGRFDFFLGQGLVA